MSTIVLILRELRHRWANATLAVLAIAGTVALLVAVRILATAAERETRRVTRDLGFNLRILPRDVDPDQFLADGHSDLTLPADAVRRLADAAGTFVAFNHLTPSLERRLPLGGRDAILTGLGTAVVGPGEKKQPMGFEIPAGKACLGHALAARLGARPGATIDVRGHPLVVQRVLVESGTDDDIRLFASLSDAQSILGLPGRISEIRAIDCLCLTGEQDAIAQLRKALERALPEARVLQLRSIADARARQRQTAEKYTAFAVPLVLLVGAAWVGILSALNVRERRPEIGLWRALGHGSARIASLVLGRAVVLGLAGAALGYWAGTQLALHQGPRIFPVTAAGIVPESVLLGWSLLLAPGFAAAASFLPAMLAVAHDPADTLRAD